MIGPVLLVAGAATAGWFAGGAGAAVAAAVVALGAVGAVAAGAAVWADRIGRMLEPEEAWRVAPRPPLFKALCDAVYRRTIRP